MSLPELQDLHGALTRVIAAATAAPDSATPDSTTPDSTTSDSAASDSRQPA
jgi:hypothetical protein